MRTAAAIRIPEILRDENRVAWDEAIAYARAGLGVIAMGALGDQAMDHLGDVLAILAELHPEERCKALDDAQAFYNAARPEARIEPVEGYETRLVSTKTPLGPTGLAAENERLRTLLALSRAKREPEA